jgi:hypothetical protein
MQWERLTRGAIACWAVAALLVECYYSPSVGWPLLRTLGPALLVMAAAISRFEPRAVAAIAATPYVFPAALFLLHDGYHVHHTTAWLAAALGFMLPDALSRPWSLPARWIVPLFCAAAVAAATAPIVVLRSVDFHLDLLTRTRTPYEALGNFSHLAIGWTIHVALIVVIAMLWFDWLASRSLDFIERWVAWPMGCSALVLCVVAAYQWALDPAFLNPTLFASMDRMTGTMFDANVSGILAALWIGGWGALAWRVRTHAMRAVAAIGIVLCWAAVWASASRTSFAVAVCLSAAASATWLLPKLNGRRGIVVAVAAFVIMAAALTVLWRVPLGGPVGRLRAMTAAGPSAVMQALWERDGYGTAGNRMIERFPLFGIGLGSFADFAPEFGQIPVADNAQNWFRQQLAETGVVGSLGWAVFLPLFVWWMFRPGRQRPPHAWALVAAIVLFAAVSLVGVPGQDPAVALTIAGFGAWLVRSQGPPPFPQRTSWLPWAAAIIVVVASVVGTTVLAVERLRVPLRIQRSPAREAAYRYGVWWTEADGLGDYRWVKRRAGIVFPAEGPRLQVSAGVNFHDLAERPVHAKVWVDRRLVIDQPLTIAQPVATAPVFVRPGQSHVFIETWSDRSVTAPEGRELALQLRWRFE